MSEHSWPALITALIAGQALDQSGTAWAMNEIMTGSATPAQLAAFAVLMRSKGETPAELAGLVQTMLAHAAPVRITGRAVDVVGTGGDRAHTVNISTMAAIVVAGTGRTVVKHGNRAASSACGAADVLEALGVAIDLPAEGVVQTVSRAGIGFCFAPVFHPGLRHAAAPRRELGVPTAFNFLGPLTNPARPSAAALGCADATMAPVMAAVLAARGDDALVFRGDDGLDELTTATTSRVWLVADGQVREGVLDPARFGIPAIGRERLRGGDAAFNAQAVHQVLAGDAPDARAAVLLNAAAAIVAYDAGVTLETLDAALDAALKEAAEAVDSGAAARLLADWVRISHEVKAGLAAH